MNTKILRNTTYAILIISSIVVSATQVHKSGIVSTKWMQYKTRNEYIIVTLSTTPHRINNIGPTIESLLAQNANIKNIYLSVPHLFKRDNLTYVIPKWLSNNPRITIIRTNDYGPATKLLGILEDTPIPENAIIITVDDDIFYPKDLILRLAYEATLKPNHVISTIGADPDYDANGIIPTSSRNALVQHREPGRFVTIVLGYHGVAYRRAFFNKDIFDILTGPKACLRNDDLYISFYLAKHNIARQLMGYNSNSPESRAQELALHKQETALHLLAPDGTGPNNKSCMDQLKTNEPTVLF